MEKLTKRGILARRISLITLVVVTLTFVILERFVSSAVEDYVFLSQTDLMLEITDTIKDSISLQLKKFEAIARLQNENVETKRNVFEKNTGRLNAVADSLNEVSPFFESIVFTDLNGTIIGARDTEQLGRKLNAQTIVNTITSESKKYLVEEYAYESPLSKKPVIFTIAPIEYEGQITGLFWAGFDLSTFSENIIRKKTIGETGYSFVMDDAGKLITHPDSSVILGDLSGEEFYQKAMEEKNAGKNMYVIEYIFRNTEKVSTISWLDELPWLVCTTQNRDEFFNLASSIRQVLIIVSALGSILIVALLAVMVRIALSTRLSNFHQLVNTVSTGDLTARATLQGNDELTTMQEKINELLENLVTLISSIKSSMKTLVATGEKLDKAVDNTFSSVGQIRDNITETNDFIQDQSANVEETSAAVEEMAKNIESLNNSIQSQASSIEESSAAIEEMIANINSISETTRKTNKTMETLQVASDEGSAKISRVSQLVVNISENSEELVDANKIISKIASQTNLLAMNAAIEAAHAGNAGRGFAVVADEIRKLAEESATHSKRIGTTIKDIAVMIDEIVTASNEADTSFGDVRKKVNYAKIAMDHALQAMEEQKAGSGEIFKVLSQMKEITATVQTGSEEMTQGNAQILSATTALSEISTKTSSAIHDITRSADAIMKSVVTMQKQSEENKVKIGVVEENVAQFKTETT